MKIDTAYNQRVLDKIRSILQSPIRFDERSTQYHIGQEAYRRELLRMLERLENGSASTQ